jgi:hypothetical protein
MMMRMMVMMMMVMMMMVMMMMMMMMMVVVVVVVMMTLTMTRTTPMMMMMMTMNDGNGRMQVGGLPDGERVGVHQAPRPLPRRRRPHTRGEQGCVPSPLCVHSPCMRHPITWSNPHLGADRRRLGLWSITKRPRCSETQ